MPRALGAALLERIETFRKSDGGYEGSPNLAHGTAYGACAGQVVPAIEMCGSPFADESCDGIATCTGQFRWAKGFGDAMAQSGSAIAVGPMPRMRLFTISAWEPALSIVGPFF